MWNKIAFKDRRLRYRMQKNTNLIRLFYIKNVKQQISQTYTVLSTKRTPPKACQTVERNLSVNFAPKNETNRTNQSYSRAQLYYFQLTIEVDNLYQYITYKHTHTHIHKTYMSKSVLTLFTIQIRQVSKIHWITHRYLNNNHVTFVSIDCFEFVSGSL